MAAMQFSGYVVRPIMSSRRSTVSARASLADHFQRPHDHPGTIRGKWELRIMRFRKDTNFGDTILISRLHFEEAETGQNNEVRGKIGIMFPY